LKSIICLVVFLLLSLMLISNVYAVSKGNSFKNFLTNNKRLIGKKPEIIQVDEDVDDFFFSQYEMEEQDNPNTFLNNLRLSIKTADYPHAGTDLDTIAVYFCPFEAKDAATEEEFNEMCGI